MSPSPAGNNDDKPDQQQQEVLVQMGRGIDTLREQLPKFFSTGHSTISKLNMSIYSRDVNFVEPHHYHLRTHGRHIYGWLMRMARSVMHCYLSDIDFTIVNMHISRDGMSQAVLVGSHVQSDAQHAGKDVKLTVQWRLTGTSRISQWWSSAVSRQDVQDNLYDGLFVYTFRGYDGLISQHSVENVMPAPRKFAALSLLGWLLHGRRQYETPSVNCQAQC